MSIREMRIFIERAPRNIRYGFRNLKTWFLVIWNDRDYDHWFLYKIIQFKLKRMERLQRKYGHSINSDKIADKMKICVSLLERLLEDDYIGNALESHEKKWGESEMIFTPIPDKKGYSELNFKVEKVTNEKEKAKETKERRTKYDLARDSKEQDLDMLFSIIRKNVEGWWD